jgi:hypothetical protein
MLQRVLAKSRSLASAQSRRTLNQETQQRRRCTTNAESEGQHASNSNSLFAKEFFEERKKFVADFVVRNGDKALYPPFVGKHQIKDVRHFLMSDFPTSGSQLTSITYLCYFNGVVYREICRIDCGREDSRGHLHVNRHVSSLPLQLQLHSPLTHFNRVFFPPTF